MYHIVGKFMVERLVKFADRLLFMNKKGGPFQQASTIKLRIKTIKPGIIHTATIWRYGMLPFSRNPVHNLVEAHATF